MGSLSLRLFFAFVWSTLQPLFWFAVGSVMIRATPDCASALTGTHDIELQKSRPFNAKLLPPVNRAGKRSLQGSPEPRPMMTFMEVHQLVNDDVIYEPHGKLQNPPVEVQGFVSAARAPSMPEISQTHASRNSTRPYG